jgi:hypothetical protein
MISGKVTATNAGGSGVPATSAAVGPITPPPPSPPPPTGTVEPTVSPAAPNLSSPTVLTTQKRLTASGSFSNRTSSISCPYAAKDSADIGSIYIGDHNLDGAAGVIRLYNGTVGTLTVERVSLLRGRYASGIICGLVHLAGCDVGSIIIRDCDYERIEPITSSGDIYAGVFTGGGHNSVGTVYGSCQSLLIERVRARGMWTAYAAGNTSYQNSDGLVGENSILNAVGRNLDIRHGADAGIDWKGPNAHFESTIVENFRENFKTWVSRHDGDVYTRFPRFAHWLLTRGDASPTVEHIVDFAEIVGTDPNIPIVKFEKHPATLRILNADLSALPGGQIAAKSDPEAHGSTLIIGNTTYDINANTVYL